MSAPATLQVSTPSDREITIIRVFDAPRHLVWEAYTRPELLKRWLGVHNGWSLEVCEIDLRVGGRYRYQWRNPKGPPMGLSGVYREVVMPERIVATEKFDEAWYPGEAVGTVIFTERGGRTTLAMTVKYETKEARDMALKSGMTQGLEIGFGLLAEVVASLGAR